MDLPVSSRPFPIPPPVVRQAFYGFVFWALFLLVLEPGNVVRALDAGRALSIAEEARRIFAAALLGAAVTPLQVAFIRRFPAAGSRAARHLAAQAALLVLLAAGMLAVADLLAPLVLTEGNPRLRTPFADQAAADFALLLAALAVSSALVQLRDARRAHAEPSRPASSGSYAARIAAPTAAGAAMIETASIDWLESQGNYVALHVGAKTHLVRMTLTQMYAQLDPADFIRIHRRIVVNKARLVRMDRLANGDAGVTLHGGTELRASRTYAEQLRQEFR